jgi:hypothetical protein
VCALALSVPTTSKGIKTAGADIRHAAIYRPKNPKGQPVIVNTFPVNLLHIFLLLVSGLMFEKISLKYVTCLIYFTLSSKLNLNFWRVVSQRLLPSQQTWFPQSRGV